MTLDRSCVRPSTGLLAHRSAGSVPVMCAIVWKSRRHRHRLETHVSSPPPGTPSAQGLTLPEGCTGQNAPGISCRLPPESRPGRRLPAVLRWHTPCHAHRGVIVMQASLSVAPQLPSAGLQPAQPPAGLGLRALPALLLFDTAIAKAVVVDPTIKQPIIPAEPATVSAEQQPPATEPTMQAPASAPQILPAIPALPVEVPLPEPVPADG